jgi:magnesium-protoporphyrin O-methyltransferase
MDAYAVTRDRVEDYFDRTATGAWERLTSDAPVSGIRATVRAGREKMRAMIRAELPTDLRGARVLDAGCGTGTLAVELAQAGADVVATDISPALIRIAEERVPKGLGIDWRAGDMIDAAPGRFDFIVAMDSMIYYSPEDVARIVLRAAPRLAGRFVFTLAPRTPMLMAMWRVGRLFPRADRSPVMVPQSPRSVEAAYRAAGGGGRFRSAGRVQKGFYISTCVVWESAA